MRETSTPFTETRVKAIGIGNATIKELVDTNSQIKSDTEFQRADTNRGRQLFLLTNACTPFISVVVTSDYDVDVYKETVIRGNDALLKCQIPSFVSDLVFVEGWVDSQGNEIRANQVDRASLGKSNPENIRN